MLFQSGPQSASLIGLRCCYRVPPCRVLRRQRGIQRVAHTLTDGDAVSTDRTDIELVIVCGLWLCLHRRFCLSGDRRLGCRRRLRRCRNFCRGFVGFSGNRLFCRLGLFRFLGWLARCWQLSLGLLRRLIRFYFLKRRDSAF